MTNLSTTQAPAFLTGQTDNFSQDMSDIATTPFIQLVQSSSHILKPNSPNYTPEARAGYLYDTETQQLHQQIDFILIKFVKGYSLFGGKIGGDKKYMGFFNADSAPHMISKFDTTIWCDTFVEGNTEYETVQGYHFCVMLPQADGDHRLQNIRFNKSSITTARQILKDIKASGCPQTGIRVTLDSRWEKANGNEWCVFNLAAVNYVQNESVFNAACELFNETDTSAMVSNMANVSGYIAPQAAQPAIANATAAQPVTPAQATPQAAQAAQPAIGTTTTAQPVTPTQTPMQALATGTTPSISQAVKQFSPTPDDHFDDDIPFAPCFIL